MSLFIRVSTNFFTHRKTDKLKMILKSVDAFWLPVRLWVYAAEHQPDGNFSSYDSEELARLLEYTKKPEALLQAFKDAGFIDKDGMIHGWEEHNGYHQVYANRAKKAADARWKGHQKSPPPPPPPPPPPGSPPVVPPVVLHGGNNGTAGAEIPTLEMCKEFATNPSCAFPLAMVEEWFNKSADRGWGQDWQARMRGAAATYRAMEHDRKIKRRKSGFDANKPNGNRPLQAKSAHVSNDVARIKEIRSRIDLVHGERVEFEGRKMADHVKECDITLRELNAELRELVNT